jgi:NAD(P)-dependent dehydrogenase (short-subunit alcohol dehydrogenase family)
MTAMVTGGSGSLGRAVAALLVGRGHDVAIVDLRAEDVEAAASELGGDGGPRVFPIACDISDPASVENAWNSAVAELSVPDVVINTAGMISQAPIVDLSVEQWNRTLAVNLTGPFLVCQHAARAWIPAGVQGSIVNVASNAAYSVSQRVQAVDYGASKAGLVGLTLHLAVHLGRHGIRANAVAPGSFTSNMNRERLKDPANLEAAVSMVPLNRLGTPEEIAATCVGLALDMTYVTGVIIAADGGTVARM